MELKNKAKNTEIIQIRVTPTMKNELQELADKSRRNVSDFMRLLIEDILTKEHYKVSKNQK